jgi:hypothetical protein
MKNRVALLIMIVGALVTLLAILSDAPTRPPHPNNLLPVGIIIFACGPFLWIIVTLWPPNE